MSYREFLLSLAMLGSVSAYSQEMYRYAVTFNDKGDYQSALENPLEFLSQRSVERRQRQGIALDSIDAPLVKEYVDRLSSLYKIVGKSRWLNAVMVEVADKSDIDGLETLDFVKEAEWVGTYLPESFTDYDCETEIEADTSEDSHGVMSELLDVNGIRDLHGIGFDGKGKLIAVTDDGFCNMDRINGGWAGKIVAVKDFIGGHDSEMYKEGNHGTRVTSCIASNLQNKYIGSAPGAECVLLRTENLVVEEPAEEYYWTFAAEFADSIGADIINVSLGYNTYDAGFRQLTHDDLDGSSVISRSADMAVGRGMVVVGSAGNEGNKTWKRICIPADAREIISVGALDSGLSVVASYSSSGPSADGRVKPDVLAPGTVYSINIGGKIGSGNGTSFASPIMAGGIACLWQALPELTARDIVELVRKGGADYYSPDNRRGYGISNLYDIYLENAPNSIPEAEFAYGKVFLKNGRLFFSDSLIFEPDSEYTIYSIDGKPVYKSKIYNREQDISFLSDGYYVVEVRTDLGSSSFKIVL